MEFLQPAWLALVRHMVRKREQFGLDHAQALLGHSSADMTEHYAAVALEKASEVAARLG